MSEQSRFPSKNDRVLYHDPLSGEACAAIVVKVHNKKTFYAPDHPMHGSPPMPLVNLVFWTEEGGPNNKMKVPWGPGDIGSYWFPHEDGPKGDWAE